MDDIILFKPLSKEVKMLLEKEGYDPVYGARPLKRYIENTLETKIARKIISGEIKEGNNIEVSMEDGEITIKEDINK